MGGKRPSRKAKKRRYSRKTARRSKFLIKGDDHFKSKGHEKPATHTQLDAELAAGMGMPDNGPKLMMNGPTENLVKALENKCPANSGTYYAFVEAFNDFTAQRTDAAAFIQRLEEVFDGHKHSHLDDFLPPISPVTSTKEYQSALQFVRNFREMLGQEHLFTFFCQVLKQCTRGDPTSRARNCDLARSLLSNHLDLLREFNQYFPFEF